MIKKKKPDFRTQDYFRFKRLGKRWRRPKGLQSKLRIRKGGSGVKPSIGYSSPKAIKTFVRYKNEFLMPVRVSSLNELNAVKTDAVVVISSKVGLKKIKQISDAAEKMGLKVFNKKRVKKSARKVAEKAKKESEKKETKEKKEHKKEEHKHDEKKEKSE
jgi:large subunit ribosomal protein L32e